MGVGGGVCGEVGALEAEGGFEFGFDVVEGCAGGESGGEAAFAVEDEEGGALFGEGGGVVFKDAGGEEGDAADWGAIGVEVEGFGGEEDGEEALGGVAFVELLEGLGEVVAFAAAGFPEEEGEGAAAELGEGAGGEFAGDGEGGFQGGGAWGVGAG